MLRFPEFGTLKKCIVNESAAMRLERVLWALVFALSVALLPMSSFARGGIESSHLGGLPKHAAMHMTAGMPLDMAADDCCLPQGGDNDVCKDMQCCAVHCSTFVPFIATSFGTRPVRTNLPLLLADQVLSSEIGSPPFRPPSA